MKSRPTVWARPAVLLDEACLPVLVVVIALGRLRFGGLGGVLEPEDLARRRRLVAEEGPQAEGHLHVRAVLGSIGQTKPPVPTRPV
jgi:hypothetical protein